MDELTQMYGRLNLAVEHIESCRQFTQLIPEVRSNIVYSKPNPETVEDVLAVDGRITEVNGTPYAAGKLVFGSSSHMARLILEVRKKNPEIRAGINFANNPRITVFLREYCEKKGWVFSVMDRSDEPDEFKEVEGASMPWKVGKAIEAAAGRVPKVFYETGAVGKEPVSVIIGEDPLEVAEEVCVIAKKYCEWEDEDR
ncbi:MAG: phosphomethylpyrimidine kinase [Candidatus Altiarchaeales archaeon]|nr:phosphomethylpyrimidine kinase [Candidatus Altiarchaeales archaeon]